MEILEIKTELESIVKRVSKLENIKNYKFETKSATEKGDNFLGDIFRVTIDDQDTEKTLDIIVKLSFKSDQIRENHPIKESYESETYFYSEVIPKFYNFQKEKLLTAPFQSVPKCYLTIRENKEEAIVMENLKTQGYELFPKRFFFDDHHNRALFREYGRFHALGFAYADQNSEDYKKLISGMKNLHKIFVSGKPFQMGVSMITKHVYDVLEDEAVKRKFEKYVENGPQILIDMCELSGGPHTTVVHGDCWSNNFMFKYNESKKIEGIRMLDWQIMKVTSPVFDLSYMFYSGGAKETYNKLDEYLVDYYESFSEFTKQLGSAPERLFPFEILKEHWKKYAAFGMLWSLFMIKIKLTEKEDIIDLKDAEKMQKTQTDISPPNFLKGDNSEYDQRVKELITHLYEIDAL